MKIQFFKNAFVLALSVGVLTFCSSPKEKEGSEEFEEWKEMDSFHMLMAEVFHPLKDSGNVQPAMEHMGQLADEAEKWANSPLPERVNTEEVKAKLEKLKTDTRALANEIKDGAPEDQVGTSLYDIHDLFHEIMETWSKGDHHDH